MLQKCGTKQYTEHHNTLTASFAHKIGKDLEIVLIQHTIQSQVRPVRNNKNQSTSHKSDMMSIVSVTLCNAVTFL